MVSLMFSRRYLRKWNIELTISHLTAYRISLSSIKPAPRPLRGE
jgi:hypothetical protein